MAKTPEVGSAAPDFTLPALTVVDGVATRRDATLSENRGRPVVLAFYPGDDTPVCTKQLCSYTSDLEQFTGVGATVWGISPQDMDSHEAFALKHKLGMPLLADVGRTVISEYGVAMFGIGVRRSVFVIDSDSIVRWRYVGLAGLKYPDAATIAAEVARL
ncbi:MAG TPA: peroxiredoxin [Micromonosporaceae bacterium]|jgi:peroxiredoxin Q/BCP